MGLGDDAAAWDATLASWPAAHLLQSHGWGAVQAGAGWRVRRLEVPVAARPLPLTVLVGGARALPPRLYVPKGPACASDDDAAWAAVLDALERLAGELGAAMMTIEPNAGQAEVATLRGVLDDSRWSAGRGVQPAHTAVVDLSGGMEAVLARMHPKGRYNVRLAERRGVTVTALDGPAEASATLGGLCAATGARQGVAMPGAAHLQLVLEAVPAARVHLATVDGEAVAGALVATFAGEAIYLYGGSTLRHRELQPSSLLHAECMRWALERGCRSYDLWGIPADDDPADPWHGLLQFKLSLGGQVRHSAGARVRVRRPVAARALLTAEAARATARRLRLRLRPSRRTPGLAVQSRREREPRGTQ